MHRAQSLVSTPCGNVQCSKVCRTYNAVNLSLMHCSSVHDGTLHFSSVHYGTVHDTVMVVRKFSVRSVHTLPLVVHHCLCPFWRFFFFFLSLRCRRSILSCANSFFLFAGIQPFLSFLMPLWFMKSSLGEKQKSGKWKSNKAMHWLRAPVADTNTNRNMYTNTNNTKRIQRVWNGNPTKHCTDCGLENS